LSRRPLNKDGKKLSKPTMHLWGGENIQASFAQQCREMVQKREPE
jgi:hypothetical protein